ncbi:hypothetical protein GQX74_014867 [Glossina fuscipes]|nr:hypothetical protein GQX74_014867 [Glossina fuscipes]
MPQANDSHGNQQPAYGKASDRGYTEKEDTYNVNQTLVPSNWGDDDDIFASISTQEILHEDVKINNFGKTSNSCAQIANKTDVQAMCKEEKMDEAPSTRKFAAVAAPCRKWRPLSLNPKFNHRPPPQLCETPERTSRQIETTTSTPGVNRPKRGRLSGLSRNYTSSKK